MSDPDLTFDCIAVQVRADRHQQIATVDFGTTDGRHIAIAFSGPGLLGLKKQIENALDGCPEIATWGGAAARH